MSHISEDPEFPPVTSFWLPQQHRGVNLPDGSTIGFPIAPLRKIVSDPLWRLLSKIEQQEVRMRHAKALKEHRRVMRRELRR